MMEYVDCLYSYVYAYLYIGCNKIFLLVTQHVHIFSWQFFVENYNFDMRYVSSKVCAT